jgi:hypothetical protein
MNWKSRLKNQLSYKLERAALLSLLDRTRKPLTLEEAEKLHIDIAKLNSLSGLHVEKIHVKSEGTEGSSCRQDESGGADSNGGV